MKAIMIFSFGIGTLWDGFTTAIGFAALLQAQTLPEYGLCIVGAIIVFGLGIGTRTIFESHGFGYILLRLIWIITVLFDFYTSFAGNAQYLVLRREGGNVLNFANVEMDIQSIMSSLSVNQLLILVFITLITSASPLVISYLLGEN